MKTEITTTCDLSKDQAQYYVNQLPKYEKVEGNIVEIKDWNCKVYKFVYENDQFKAI